MNKMKKENNTKKVIFTDTEMLAVIEQSKEAKNKAYNELKAYIEQFVQVEDLTNRYELEQAIEDKTKDLPSYLSIDKKKELIEFSQSKYEFLLERYTNTEIVEAECYVYAETEQELERLRLSENFIKAFNDLQDAKTGYTILKIPFVNSLGGILKFSYQTNEVLINHNFIKGI
jgi:hypothetical protein